MLRLWLIHVFRTFIRDAAREGMLAGIHDAAHELGVLADAPPHDPIQAADHLRQLIAQSAIIAIPPLAMTSTQNQGKQSQLKEPSATSAPDISPKEQIASLKAALEAGGQLNSAAVPHDNGSKRPLNRPRKEGQG